MSITLSPSPAPSLDGLTYEPVRIYTGPSREGWEILGGLEPVNYNRTRADTTERTIELDTPDAIDRAVRFLKGQPTKRVDAGENSDSFCLGLAYWLRDMGVSQERAPSLIKEHWADRCTAEYGDKWDLDFIETKVANAWKHPQNKAPGRDASRGAEAFAHLATAGEPDDEPFDILGDGSVLPEATLTADMLPKVIADFASDEARRLGVNLAMVALP